LIHTNYPTKKIQPYQKWKKKKAKIKGYQDRGIFKKGVKKQKLERHSHLDYSRGRMGEGGFEGRETRKNGRIKRHTIRLKKKEIFSFIQYSKPQNYLACTYYLLLRRRQSSEIALESNN